MGISKMRQRLGYGAADMASNLIWPMICTYLTVYYTDALLLDTAADHRRFDGHYCRQDEVQER